jgi:uncharacterized SAM-binding protein YcdF (DUF218 family)
MIHMETWSYAWAVRNLIAELIMPPGIWVLWVLLMLFLFKKHELIKKTLIVFGIAMIWLTSTNFFANHFTQIAGHLLEWPQPLMLEEGQSKELIANQAKASSPTDAYQLKSKQLNATSYTQGLTSKEVSNEVFTHAIVILGGGRQKGALDLPEYQYQNTSPQSMERLRAGARLAKVTKLPILLTGGAPDRTDAKDLSEAKVMSMVLKEELGIDARWLEEQSNTTQENALQSAQILKKEGIKTIYLVTHFWHMPRAKVQFEKQGLKVIEAPMGLYQKEQYTPLDFCPSSEGLQRTRWIWHELLGGLWYRVKF